MNIDLELSEIRVLAYLVSERRRLVQQKPKDWTADSVDLLKRVETKLDQARRVAMEIDK